jgi:mannose-6-phosphate isomerase-like protein (cupin superfamily)
MNPAKVRRQTTARLTDLPNVGPAMARDLEPGVSVGATGRDWGDGLVCRIPSSATGGASCTFEQTLAPGAGVPLHVHAHDDELHVVLGGTIAMRCGDRDFTAASGTVAFLPRRVPHAFRNPGDAPARLLTVFTPGGFDDLVAELRGMPPADAGDETKRDVIRARHGIRIIHPTTG